MRMFKGKRIILTSICVLAFFIFVISGIIAILKPEIDLANRLFNLLYTIGQLLGLGFIFVSIKLKDILQNVFLKLGFVVGIVGILLLIMYLPWHTIILPIGVLLVIIGSIKVFIGKESKEALDYIRIIWLPCFLIAAVFKLYHYPGGELMLISSSVILWLAVVNYAFKYENKITGAKPL